MDSPENVDPAELIITLEEQLNDPMAPAGFADEVVAYMASQEDLEGDGPMITQKLQEGIQNSINAALESGHIQDGSVITINFAVRDPYDGEATYLIQTQAAIAGGEIVIDNAVHAHTIDENLELVSSTFSPETLDAAKEAANTIVESMGLNAQNNDFVKSEGMTYNIQAFTPEP